MHKIETDESNRMTALERFEAWCADAKRYDLGSKMWVAKRSWLACEKAVWEEAAEFCRSKAPTDPDNQGSDYDMALLFVGFSLIMIALVM